MVGVFFLFLKQQEANPPRPPIPPPTTIKADLILGE